MEEIQQLKTSVAVESKSPEVLLVESSELFHRYRALWENIHPHQTWFDQRLMDPMEILLEALLEARHCGNNPLLAVEEVADSPEQAVVEQMALWMDAKTHRHSTVLPCAFAIDRVRQVSPLQRAGEMHPDAGQCRWGHLSSEHLDHLDREAVVQVPGSDWIDLDPRSL